MSCSTLALHFSANSETTNFRALRQDPPWRALRGFSNPSGEALVHLHNVSGGILGGDNLHLEVVLTPNAQVQITTVGATRIHRHRPGRPDASQTARFHLANSSLLEYLPDPLIPFAHSRFTQNSEIHLSEDAGLICWETIAAGRIFHGESFAFDDLSINTSIHSPIGPIALERYQLSPSLQPIHSPARMGPFLYSATMYVCRANASLRWLPLENQLNEIARGLSGPECCWGASALVRDGLVIRGMTQHAHQASQALHRFWHTAKQCVWGRPASLPRKIY
jgi:urease accessory protein